MSTLTDAIMIASDVHRLQVDKAGEPYILHPMRLVCFTSTPDERIVAMLHDVIEDSRMTIKKLREYGFSGTILSAIDALTKRKNEAYTDYIERVSQNSLATSVKMLDLTDNMNLSRLSSITDEDFRRNVKYREARNRLMRAPKS